MMRGRNLNLIAFVLICGAISYYDMKRCHRLPWPPRFMYAALTFLMMELLTMVDDTLGGVTAIGFVIAVFIKDGFVSDCDHGIPTTGQPQTTAFLGDSSASAQTGAISSVAEYQGASGQAAPMPGVTTT